MRVLKTFFIYISIIFNIGTITAQISIDDTKDAINLTGILTDNNSCVDVSNESATGDTFSGARKSYAYFNKQTGNFPFTEGIVLSSWSSPNSVGPFVRNQGGGNLLWQGDPDLDLALGIKSVNATVLEFDFVPLTNFISFNYIFASNEYQDDFPCRYSDGFAFLIKENVINSVYKNLAVIPETTIPVSSMNIHPAISFETTTCAAKNLSYFGNLNTAPNNTSPINYAGQTKVMNAQTAVVAGKSYHIKLVIADDEVQYYDSAVFLEAGSFTSKIDLGADRLLATNNAICFGEKYIIDTKLPTNYSYKWFKNNILISGATNPSYEVTDAGTYKVEITLNPTICITTSEIKIEYTPETILKNTILVQCDNDLNGLAFFNLTRADNIIKNNNTGLGTIEYFESLTDAQQQVNPITNNTNYQNKSLDQILIARVSNSYGCINYAELTLQISNNTIADQNPIKTCDNDNIQDGLYVFDLNSQVSPQLLNGLPSGLTVAYYLNQNDAETQQNSLPNIFNNTEPYQQLIYARVLNGSDCYVIKPISLEVYNFKIPPDRDYLLCDGETLLIEVNQGLPNYQYLWNTGETTNSIKVDKTGNYSVEVTNPNGCKYTLNFGVKILERPVIKNIKVNDLRGNKNSILIEYTGSGDFEFTIDGNNYQDNPFFEGIAPGLYYASIRDKNGCGQTPPIAVYVLDYPRYFTPNGDGFNDTWQIKNLDFLPKSVITIFDRYGKFLKELDPSENGWDGIYNGHELPATDYWFNLSFENGRIIKGHFSLKR